MALDIMRCDVGDAFRIQVRMLLPVNLKIYFADKYKDHPRI